MVKNLSLRASAIFRYSRLICWNSSTIKTADKNCFLNTRAIEFFLNVYWKLKHAPLMSGVKPAVSKLFNSIDYPGKFLIVAVAMKLSIEKFYIFPSHSYVSEPTHNSSNSAVTCSSSIRSWYPLCTMMFSTVLFLKSSSKNIDQMSG